MKNEENLNHIQGDRLRECLKDANITQIQLARLTNYTPQHINNIVNGRKNMSVESARSFANKLNVSETYLLGESDYKTMYDELNHTICSKSAILDHVEKLIYFLGYQKKCKYWYGWDNMECPAHTSEELKDLKDHTTKEEIIASFSNHSRLVLEFEKPNHSMMTCDEEKYRHALLEIIEYIKFKMDILEKEFDFDLFDQNNQTVFRVEESIVQIFDENYI